MPGCAPSANERVGVIKGLALEVRRPEQRVIQRFLIKVGVLRIVVGKVELVLEEDEAAA